MSLPTALREELQRHAGAVPAERPVGGGCISRAARLEVGGRPAFLKYHLDAPAGFFAAEADGLERLRAAQSGLRVPGVLGTGELQTPQGRLGWLLLEWLQPGRPGADSGERLGEGLARLHRVRGPGWGAGADGFIGALPQENTPAADWPAFWRERRLRPQLERARRAGRLPATEREWQSLCERLPALLAPAEVDGASLLHGDLWGGNVLLGEGGEPALIDAAASYHGHREVDLAMSELFGGFPPAFGAAYRAAWPLAPGYPQRRAVYQLFYLLAHVNLFGGGYVAQTAGLLRQVLAAR